MPAKEGSDYFALFGLARCAVLDIDELAQRFRQLQSHAHPDRHAGASQLQQQLALQQSSLINDAYAVLKKPLSCAAYLLSLYGVDVYAEHDTAMPVDFLQQQLQWREALMEEEGEPARAELRREISQVREALAADAQKAVEAVVAENGKNAQSAYDLLRRWIYMEKLTALPEFSRDG